MSISDIRELFPILNNKINGRKLVYFDNAATSQRPSDVIDYFSKLSLEKNSNIHRAVHKTATDATEEFESTRDFVKEYLNAKYREEIIFTSGTTASINLLAFSFGEAFVEEGDEIIVSEAEHHSNIVPWQMMCQRRKAVLKVIPVEENGEINLLKLNELITSKTKLVSITHISNVLGIVNPIREIIEICHAKSVPVSVDGAQGIVHQDIDVQALDCDFYSFSGHKVYASTGTGVLYGKKEFLENMPPYMGGGEMIATVRFSGTTYAELPEKFEAGTQNINGIPTLKLALNLLQSFKSASEETEAVKDYLYNALLSDERIKVFGVPRGTSEKIPLFSFVVNGVHHEDLALILDKMGVAVRSGQMCAEPLMDRFGVTGMLRASLAPYNTMEEAEYFIKSLDRAIKMFI